MKSPGRTGGTMTFEASVASSGTNQSNYIHMKKYRTKEEQLRDILKENGLEKPSEQFSDQLTHFIVQEYKRNQVVEFKAGKWLGKLIIGVLVAFNILFLFYLNPFSIQPVLSISIAAFILGLWGLIGLTRKSQLSKISSI